MCQVHKVPLDRPGKTELMALMGLMVSSARQDRSDRRAFLATQALLVQ